MTVIANIDEAIAAFYESSAWKDCEENETFKKYRGLRNAVEKHLRTVRKIPEELPLTVQEVRAIGLIENELRSRWRKKAAETVRKKKRLKKRLAEKRKKRLMRKAKRAFKSFRLERETQRKEEEAARRPLLFGDTLPTQHRPPRIR